MSVYGPHNLKTFGQAFCPRVEHRACRRGREALTGRMGRAAGLNHGSREVRGCGERDLRVSREE